MVLIVEVKVLMFIVRSQCILKILINGFVLQVENLDKVLSPGIYIYIYIVVLIKDSRVR